MDPVDGDGSEESFQYPLRRDAGESGPRSVRSPLRTGIDPSDEAENWRISGVVRPSFNVSCTPVMNCRTLPELNRLDHEPREEFEEESGIRGAVGEEGRRGQFGERGLGRARLK